MKIRNSRHEFPQKISNTMLTPNDVFTPGRLPIKPTNIYAARGESEKLFSKTLERGMVPVVFGEYGVGKTSMARYALRGEDDRGMLVNIESAADKSMKDVFTRCLELLGYSVKVRKNTGEEKSATHEQTGQAEASGFGFLRALIASKRTKGSGENLELEERFVVTSPTDSRIIEICEQKGVALIIDELHQASSSFTSDLAKFIKTYGNASCHSFKIILLGTSSDASQLVSSDQGIDRLLQEVHLQSMNSEEATYVVEKGMGDLEICIDSQVTGQIVRACVGSPSILQYLSLEVAEAAFTRDPRACTSNDVKLAITTFVERKEARLYRSYVKAVENVGEFKYRKQVLRAMAECEDDYVTMEMIRDRVSSYLGSDTPSTTLSGPLRQLKEDRYGSVLTDVDRPDGTGRVGNYTTFKDPALKSFIRLQLIREEDSRV